MRLGGGDDDTGRGARNGTIEDAADAAVSEDIADAELVGVVDPFDNVRPGVEAWGR